jgi:molybdopterin-guanine dinucleotide biosynthesis protein A
MRIGVILAGGGGRRMRGADKGAQMLGGARLVDRVLARLTPQTDRVLISGAIFYVLLNFTIDALYVVLDPRIRRAHA